MNEYRVFRDGADWCAVREPFIDLQVSASGFGKTPDAALRILLDIPHIHQARHGSDACFDCGHDLRHEVHIRRTTAIAAGIGGGKDGA